LFLSLPPTTPQAFPSRTNDPTSASPESSDLRLAALETLVNSVRAEPYNWSAWLKIAECLDGPEEVSRVGWLGLSRALVGSHPFVDSQN
jgi:anaphase-promoting complex subunit 8